LQALPGTQGIYGLLSAILILQKFGVFGGGTQISFGVEFWQRLLVLLWD
jgi:hypothetical protein